MKIPQLILTSEVDLSLANGKGGVKLNWSGYDISDKYFVIYRKEENESDWKVIVSLEDKFNGNSYIDETAHDKKAPNVPVINIEGVKESNSINATAASNDNETKYVYYIESYDSSGSLLNSSN